MPTPPERPTACPACGTTVRGDVSWCTSCYAPLTGREPTSEAESVPPAGADALADGSPGASAADRTPIPAADPVQAAAMADRMLAELAAGSGPPSWARWLPSSRAGRTALLIGTLVLGSTLLVALMAVLGTVF